jgi:hypothetical protein
MARVIGFAPHAGSRADERRRENERLTMSQDTKSEPGAEGALKRMGARPKR